MVEDSFSHDEPAGKRALLLASLLLNTFQHLLQALHIIMIIPPDSRTGDL